MSKQYEGLDRYLGRFSGTFDVAPDDVTALDPDGVVVAIVVCQRVGANEKNDQRTGEDTVTYVLKPVEFSVIQDEALARALRHSDNQVSIHAKARETNVQLTLPFPKLDALTDEGQWLDTPFPKEDDDLVTVEEDEEEVFVPPARALDRPTVGGALRNDPVLARFVNGGER